MSEYIEESSSRSKKNFDINTLLLLILIVFFGYHLFFQKNISQTINIDNRSTLYNFTYQYYNESCFNCSFMNISYFNETFNNYSYFNITNLNESYYTSENNNFQQDNYTYNYFNETFVNNTYLNISYCQNVSI